MDQTMTDHAPRIRAQQRQAEELAAIKELETRVAPLIWLVYAAAFVVAVSIAVHGWQKYAELVSEHEAMLKCINGQSVGLRPLSNFPPQAGERANEKNVLSDDPAVMRCTLRENKPLLLTGRARS